MAFGIRISGLKGLAESIFGDAEAALTEATTQAVEVATNGAKDEMRAEIVAAGFAQGQSLMLQSRLYPGRGKKSLGTAGYIYIKGKRGGAMMDAFVNGATIRPVNGRKFLAIPTPAVPIDPAKSRGAVKVRMTPARVEEQFGVELRPVPAKGGRYVLLLDNVMKSRGRTGWRFPKDAAARGKRRSVVMFILVPQVRLKPRLKPEPIAQAWADRVPDIIDRLLRD